MTMDRPSEPVREVPIRDVEQALRVVRVGDRIVLELPGRWRLRLRRPEAWELAEVLDEIATAR